MHCLMTGLFFGTSWMECFLHDRQILADQLFFGYIKFWIQIFPVEIFWRHWLWIHCSMGWKAFRSKTTVLNMEEEQCVACSKPTLVLRKKRMKTVKITSNVFRNEVERFFSPQTLLIKIQIFSTRLRKREHKEAIMNNTQNLPITSTQVLADIRTADEIKCNFCEAHLTSLLG